MRYGAVIFDLDDTLIVEAATARRSLRDSIEELVDGAEPDRAAAVVLARARERWHAGPHHRVCDTLGFASWEGLWATFDGCHPSLDPLRAWVPGYRRDAWRHGLEELGVFTPELGERLAGAYTGRQRQGHPLIDGAADLVAAVSATTPVGLLTNGPADIQRVKLGHTGLEHHFTSVVISGETAVGKPDPRAFDLVLGPIGVAPQDAVMIGDSWERDVRGALAAGMSAIWISGGQAPPEPHLEVAAVPSIGDLAGILLG